MQSTVFLAFALSQFAALACANEPPNPNIDYSGFVTEAARLEPLREQNRLSEAEFIHIAATPRTIILDARSADRFNQLHIKGAVHLALTDFTADALAKLIPDKSTRILIYCNNNFAGEPVNFAAKMAPVALNIQTFINLHAYGYDNVMELGPVLDVNTTKIPFAGESVTTNPR